MSTLNSLPRFVGLFILIALYLSGCNGSAAGIDDLNGSSGTGEEGSYPSSEYTLPEPTAEQVEEPDYMITKNVLVEIRVPREFTTEEVFLLITGEFASSGFELDPEYQPVPVSPREEDLIMLGSADETVVIVRGTIIEEQEEELKKDPRVIAVWSDARIEPLDN
jgi:hypothetical protein